MIFAHDHAKLERECDDAIVKIANGEKDALKTVFTAYSQFIASAAYQILQNKEDSEDVLQDVMIKIASSASSYRPGSSPRAWIASVTRNTALDKLRKRRNNVSLDTYSDTSLPEELVYEDSEEKRLLGDALRTLDAEDRLVINLKLHMGFKYKEIACALGISPHAAQKRYERAIKKLRVYFEEEGKSV